MTFDQLKVFLTRIGKWSKVVLCGDIAQVSPKFKGSGLAELIKMIKHFNMSVHTVEFTTEDILRSEQCKDWLINFEKWEEMKESKE
jgi:phosphate starvation-inducible PhoH-like protein